MQVYSTKIFFQDRHFDVEILPKQIGFDLHLSFENFLTGEDYQKLRKYLIDEGYVDAAQELLKL